MREADGLPAACFALAANAVLHDLKLWRRGDLDYSPYYGAFQANREKAQLQEPRVEKFVAHVRSIDDLEAAVAFLRERLEPRGFRVESSRSLVDFYLRLRTALAVVCLFIVVVPFLVCAATIFLAFNSMVNNRRQEIGILQALGLKSVSILAIYLLEAGMLGAAGGVVGLAGGLAVLGPVDALLGSQLGIDANEGLLDFGAGNAAFSLAVAVVVSLLGALVPAVKAARNDPICSLSAP
jgi:putative ABC transport system permease protein